MGTGHDTIHDSRKLAYGHVFVLLAGASAKLAGHGDADRLIDDATSILETHFWEEDHGLFADEWNQDWTPFSNYPGLNAKMHGPMVLIIAFEAPGSETLLQMAGRMPDFFFSHVTPTEHCGRHTIQHRHQKPQGD